MTYRDMTFCYADCLNSDCMRHSSNVQDDLPEWMPVSWSDFSVDCDKFVSAKGTQDEQPR